MEVALFIPCFVDQLRPQTAFNMIKVLEKAGCNVHYNQEQTCCGKPPFQSGYEEEAKDIGEKFLKDFSNNDYPIITLDGGCTTHVRQKYPKLFHNSANHVTAGKVSRRIFEFTEFLTQQIHKTDFNASFPHRVTYHDGCNSLRGCHLKKTPRLLLSKVAGLELVEMDEAETCCGREGHLNINYPKIATSMVRKKVKSAIAARAKFILSNDFSCLIHIQNYIKEEGIRMDTLHIADVLASGW